MAKDGLDALVIAAGPPKRDGGELPKAEEGDAVSRAGARFGAAVKSGVGKKIADAYKALKAACEAEIDEEAGAEDTGEPPEGY